MKQGVARKPISEGVAVRAFRRVLLRWYDQHRRDLPWRETRDPYRIWISEIMLQQTRVAAVLEHYRLFLERFPNIHRLASSTESQVLAAWSGLGYYRRARMMLGCAQRLAAEQAGAFPHTSHNLQALPGIGRYTAAAIASIAFGEPVAVVDGNVERVLERLYGRSLAKKESWQEAQLLIDESRPGDFNQAMMELGATICTPRQPKCKMCPVRKWCLTRSEVPRTSPPESQTKKEIWCALDHRDGRIRLVQRLKKASLMAGMWELPQGIRAAGSSAPWRTFRHSITTTNYTVHVLRDNPPKKVLREPSLKIQGRWISKAQLRELPITGLTRKILKAAGII